MSPVPAEDKIKCNMQNAECKITYILHFCMQEVIMRAVLTRVKSASAATTGNKQNIRIIIFII